MPSQDVLLTTCAQVLPTSVIFNLLPSSVNSLMADLAFPPFLALRGTTLLTFLLPILMNRYFLMVLEAVVGPTFYMTFTTCNQIFFYRTVLPFTNDTCSLTMVFLSVVVVL